MLSKWVSKKCKKKEFEETRYQNKKQMEKSENEYNIIESFQKAKNTSDFWKIVNMYKKKSFNQIRVYLNEKKISIFQE